MSAHEQEQIHVHVHAVDSEKIQRTSSESEAHMFCARGLLGLKNVQQVGLHAGYSLRAFEALSSQINGDISKKSDFASN